MSTTKATPAKPENPEVRHLDGCPQTRSIEYRRREVPRMATQASRYEVRLAHCVECGAVGRSKPQEVDG